MKTQRFHVTGNKYICFRRIRDMYDIHVVPKLVIVKGDGEVISSRGRKEVTDRGVVAIRSWFDIAGIKFSSPSKSDIFESSVFDDEDQQIVEKVNEKERTVNETLKDT